MQNQSREVLNSVKFLATTLHEIRTPIQTIVGEAELLKNTNLDQEQTEYIRQIQFSAEALLSLANNILDYSKITRDDFQLKNAPFNIIELVEKTTDFISLEAFNKGLEIVTDIDNSVAEEIIGDSVRVQQILLNLIKNAVKFTAHGFVHITVGVVNLKSAKNQQKFLEVKITDTGIGIPEESRKNLFEAYYQVDGSSTRNFEGTGLGLAISKSLINAMNGQIGVAENKPNGSIFYFRIPYFPVEQNQQKNFTLKIPENSKILIVDDSSLATQSLKNDLQKFGIKNIFSTPDATDALKLLKSHAKDGAPFTTVFIDLIMPKVDGWHLAAVINDDTEINSAKLYLLIPEGQMGGEARMKMLNWFDGYIYKPIKRKNLFDLIQQNLIERKIENKTENQNQNQIQSQSNSNSNLKENSQSNSQSQLQNENQNLIAKNLKILVAEDHLVNRRIVVTFLKKLGATIFEAENGKDAISIINTNPDIDFIFMDILMPLVNGIDATKAIRATGFKGIIIACTANSDTEDFAHYKKIGMNDILIKPFKSLHVKEILEKWKTAYLIKNQNELSKNSDAYFAKIITWNEADFMDTVSNDFNFGKQLLTDFINQTDSLVKDIPQFIHDKNFTELRRIGHTITGSSSTVSAFMLSSYGTKLNKSAKIENCEELALNYNSICLELKRLKKIINNWIEKNELQLI